MDFHNKRQSGFTLIEIMIAVAVISAIVAIAVPQYNDYIRKSKLVEATSTLLEYRTRMEQYYQDNRGYAEAAATDCGVVPAAFPNRQYFDFTCTVPGSVAPNRPQTYTLTATGKAGTDLRCYSFLVNDQNVRTATINGTNYTRWPTSGPAC